MTTNEIFTPSSTTFLGNASLRFNQEEVTEILAKTYFMNAENIDNNERMVDNLLSGTEFYTFGSTSLTMYLASEEKTDTDLRVSLEYYTTAEDENISNIIISTDMTDGQTPILISDDVYRIERIIMLDDFSGNVWIGELGSFSAGIPTTKYGGCSFTYKVSRLPYIYVPPNKKLYGLNLNISSNVIANYQTQQNILSGVITNVFEQINLRLLRFPDSSNQNMTYEILKKYISNNDDISMNFICITPAISGSTSYITADLINGVNDKSLSILIEYLLVKF